jgi:hypothetical protein
MEYGMEWNEMESGIWNLESGMNNCIIIYRR